MEIIQISKCLEIRKRHSKKYAIRSHLNPKCQAFRCNQNNSFDYADKLSALTALKKVGFNFENFDFIFVVAYEFNGRIIWTQTCNLTLLTFSKLTNFCEDLQPLQMTEWTGDNKGD